MVQKILNDEKRNIDKKRIYRKPELTQVQLVAEQAVIALCKTGGGGSQHRVNVSPRVVI